MGGATEYCDHATCCPWVAQQSIATMRREAGSATMIAGACVCVNRCVVDTRLRSTAGGIPIVAYLVRAVTITGNRGCYC